MSAHGHGSDVGGWMGNRLVGAVWGFAAYLTYLIAETAAAWTFGATKPPLDFDGLLLFVVLGAIFGKWAFVLSGLMVLGNILFVQARASRTPQEYLLGPVLFWTVAIVLGLIVYKTSSNRGRIKEWAVKKAASWKKTYAEDGGIGGVFDRIRHIPFKGWTVAWTLAFAVLFVWFAPRFAVLAAVAAGVAFILWQKFGRHTRSRGPVIRINLLSTR